MTILLWNLVHKKFVKPCYQTKLSQEFAIPVNDSNLWKNIKMRKVKDINDNKIAEFIFKMLRNISATMHIQVNG